jgi:hypothetical protein
MKQELHQQQQQQQQPSTSNSFPTHLLALQHFCGACAQLASCFCCRSSAYTMYGIHAPALLHPGYVQQQQLQRQQQQIHAPVLLHPR